MEQLTKDEITTLLDALKAWKKEPTSTGMMVGMIDMMLAKNKDEAKGKLTASMADKELEVNEREEIATILSAKLLLMRDRIEDQTP